MGFIFTCNLVLGACFYYVWITMLDLVLYVYSMELFFGCLRLLIIVYLFGSLSMKGTIFLSRS